MHPAEISEGVGHLARERQADASFPLEVNQLIDGSGSSETVCEHYWYIFSADSPAPFGRVCGKVFFGPGSFLYWQIDSFKIFLRQKKYGRKTTA